MKTLLAAVVLGGMAVSNMGCLSTVAYSGRERGQIIARNMSYEGGMIQDDIDNLLLLRPPSRLTIWNVR